jgi:hypothetical protein
MVVLAGRELEHGGDVIGLKIGIVRQDLIAVGTGREEVPDVLHAKRH